MPKLLKYAVVAVIAIIALTVSSKPTFALHNCSPLSSAPDFPGAIACLDGDSFARGPTDDIRFIVIHATDGPTTTGAVDTLLIGGNSAHYVVDHTGLIIQMVKEDDVAFHAGNFEFNRHSIGVENVGEVGKPNLGHTAEQFQDLLFISGILVSRLADKYGIPKVRITREQLLQAERDGTLDELSGLIAHADIPNAHPESQPPHPTEDANAISHCHHTHNVSEGTCPGIDFESNTFTTSHWGGHSGHTDPGSTWDWDRYIDILNSFPIPRLFSPIDVFMLVDLTGSFSDDLPVFKAQAPGVIARLTLTDPNIRFGLAKFEDYPISPWGTAACGDKAYEKLVDLTFNSLRVLTTIAGLSTRCGADGPESQLVALYQAATGEGQDLSAEGFPEASIPPGQQASFRDGATKIFLLWTDAPFHQPGDPGDIPRGYPGPSFDETIDAILALDPPKVIGVSSGTAAIPDLARIAAETNAFAPEGGVDCDNDGVIDINEGEPLVCGIATSGVGIGEAIVALIEAASVPTEPPITPVQIDIKPGSDPNSINCNNEQGVIPVALLTTDDFDATPVDHAMVRFEGAAETHISGQDELFTRHEEDVDGDGDIDLVFHFRLGATTLTCEATEATLTGETFDGQAIEGTDVVRMIDRGGGKP